MIIDGTKNFNIIYGMAMGEVMDYILDRIEDECKDMIREIVYDPFEPEEYERTEQFMNSWKGTRLATTKSDIKGSTIVNGIMTQDANLMEVNRELNQHGSSFSKRDIRDRLSSIIFEGKAGGAFGKGFWTEPRDAWTPLIIHVNLNMDRWVKEAMALQGLVAVNK